MPRHFMTNYLERCPRISSLALQQRHLTTFLPGRRIWMETGSSDQHAYQTTTDAEDSHVRFLGIDMPAVETVAQIRGRLLLRGPDVHHRVLSSKEACISTQVQLEDLPVCSELVMCSKSSGLQRCLQAPFPPSEVMRVRENFSKLIHSDRCDYFVRGELLHQGLCNRRQKAQPDAAAQQQRPAGIRTAAGTALAAPARGPVTAGGGGLLPARPVRPAAARPRHSPPPGASAASSRPPAGERWLPRRARLPPQGQDPRFAAARLPCPGWKRTPHDAVTSRERGHSRAASRLAPRMARSAAAVPAAPPGRRRLSARRPPGPAPLRAAPPCAPRPSSCPAASAAPHTPAGSRPAPALPLLPPLASASPARSPPPGWARAALPFPSLPPPPVPLPRRGGAEMPATLRRGHPAPPADAGPARPRDTGRPGAEGSSPPRPGQGRPQGLGRVPPPPAPAAGGVTARERCRSSQNMGMWGAWQRRIPTGNGRGRAVRSSGVCPTDSVSPAAPADHLPLRSALGEASSPGCFEGRGCPEAQTDTTVSTDRNCSGSTSSALVVLSGWSLHKAACPSIQGAQHPSHGVCRLSVLPE